MTHKILYDIIESSYVGPESEKIRDKIHDKRLDAIKAEDDRIKKYDCNLTWDKEYYWKNPAEGCIAMHLMEIYRIWLIFNDNNEAMQYKLRYGEDFEPIRSVHEDKDATKTLLDEMNEATEKDIENKDIKTIDFVTNCIETGFEYNQTKKETYNIQTGSQFNLNIEVDTFSFDPNLKYDNLIGRK